MNTDGYSQREKMFLAGSIKMLIMTHGGIADEELTDLDRLTDTLGFYDFGVSLEMFEEEVRDTESYWDAAVGITRSETREDILSVLSELSVQEGYASASELKLIDDLRRLWDMD